MSNPSVALYFQIRGSKNHKLQIANKVVIELLKNTRQSKKAYQTERKQVIFKKDAERISNKALKKFNLPISHSPPLFCCQL